MQQIEDKSVTLVLGGVRSGKSRYAQSLAAHSARVTFLATAERRDDAEMKAKIERHRADRPDTWKTVEEPIELANAVRLVEHDCDVILIDCLTLFAANILEAEGNEPVRIRSRIDALCVALESTHCSVIMVSNEVGSGVVPAYALGRRYRDLVGEINQRIAAVADNVILLVAGLPLALKGMINPGVEL